MPDILDLPISSRVRAVVYGRSGVGKTWGAGTFPRPNFLDFDQGVTTFRNPDFISKYGSNILYEQFIETSVNSRGIITAHKAYDNACKYFDARMKGEDWVSPTTGKSTKVGPDDFDTWVVDTCTSLIGVARNKAVNLLGTGAMKEKTNTFNVARTQGIMAPEGKDHGAERSLTEQFVRMIRDSGKHVLILAHERETVDRAGVNVIVPYLTGQSSEAVSAMFDEVWRLCLTGVGSTRKRVLTTDTDTVMSAKSRLGLPSGTPFEWSEITKALAARVSQPQ